MDPLDIADALVAALEPLRFKTPITHVYNPLVYARASHHQYLQRYGYGRREVILLGMNPGPWGMVQTGVPFGEVNLVRDWLKINGPVSKPPREHAKRPIEGFACARSEVSGARLWGWARDTFGTPKRFFKRFFVANYCPLTFMEKSGRNFTPDRLPVRQRARLMQICDRALRQTVDYSKSRYVIGVGAFAETRAKAALNGMDVTVGRILHPSPASPAANRDWSGTITRQFRAMGIELPE